MLRFGQTKIEKENFYAAKKPIEMWDVNVDNIVISKLVTRKINSKYFIGYLDKDIKPLVLIMSKKSRYFKTFKVENKINKLMSFCINDEKLLETYKAIWTNIENLKRFKLNALSVYDDRYIKTKRTTYGDKFDTNFRDLNVLEDDIECKSFTAISIDSLLAYNKT